MPTQAYNLLTVQRERDQHGPVWVGFLAEQGVDVGAKVEIYAIINELASRGLGLVLARSEMMEIIGMCDRVAVMSAGRIRAVLEKEAMSEEAILRAAISQQQACDIGRS